MRSGDRSQSDASRAFGARKVISSVRSRFFSCGGQELGDELGELSRLLEEEPVGGVGIDPQPGAGQAVGEDLRVDRRELDGAVPLAASRWTLRVDASTAEVTAAPAG
jgi:hypothetical protein